MPEFWSQRWHISLMAWFRDYLYIPLGGNRVSKPRWYLNILVVFVVSGLWHGAGLTFIIWGGLNGAYQVIYLMAAGVAGAASPDGCPARSGACWRCCSPSTLSSFTWVFFRADTLAEAWTVITKIYGAPADAADAAGELQLDRRPSCWRSA